MRRDPEAIASSDDISFVLWSVDAVGNHNVPTSSRRLLAYGLRVYGRYLDAREARQDVQAVYVIVSPSCHKLYVGSTVHIRCVSMCTSVACSVAKVR